jgi:uncharacterized protein YjcR|tara:strand:+ start:396 stop:1073 length:678 start_codon:yes stop_codon:yes gene_type:complete
MSNKLLKLNPKKMVAAECFANNPSMRYVDVAEVVGVHKDTIKQWRKDPLFVEAIYDKYMVQFGAELPSVLNAMVREACAGNVQAGRLVLEHSGKLIKNVNISIDSPFDKFLKSSNSDGKIIEKEKIDAIEADFQVMETNMEMTERDESNDYPRSRERREKKELKQSIGAEQKKIDYLKKKRERYALRKRAEDVGLDQLPQGRANKSVRVAWIEELEKRERRSKEL